MCDSPDTQIRPYSGDIVLPKSEWTEVRLAGVRVSKKKLCPRITRIAFCSKGICGSDGESIYLLTMTLSANFPVLRVIEFFNDERLAREGDSLIMTAGAYPRDIAGFPQDVCRVRPECPHYQIWRKIN